MVTTEITGRSTFPEAWRSPAAAGDTFMLDPMHFPFPISPLTDSSLSPAFAAGFTKAAREYNTPIREVRVTSCNWYHFERYDMAQPSTEEEGRAMGELAEATIKPEIGRILDRWHEEHLPALRVHLQRLREMDVESGPPASVTAFIDEIAAIHADIWTIHFRIAIPMLMGMQIFDEFYADLFGGNDGDGHALLTGVSSESVNAGLALSDLAVRARELGLAACFEQTPSDALHRELQSSEAGRAFLSELQPFLEVYGLRQDLFDFITPTWQEDPSFALSSVRNYVKTGRDARAEYAAKRQASTDAADAVRARLVAYPEAVRGEFEGLLQIGRACSFLQEEHNFYIDQQGESLIRLVYLRLGRRLVRDGGLASADDIFMLTNEEICALAEAPDPAAERFRIDTLVRQRQAELRIAATLTPPPFIGDPPAGPPPSGNPMERALGRFFGGPPQAAEASDQLKGNAGSRGVVSGVAHVARTLEEATAVLPGEILVAVTTMPAWTPLFGVAAAVVTETGGPLSHCAIVAREYGIPAVVGVHGATRAIVTGQLITVDGGRGLVTIER